MPILTVVCYAAFGRCHWDDYWFLREDEGGCICGRRDVGGGDWEKGRYGKLRSECDIGE